MRARVRRTAACAPHGTTRPHDLPQKSEERRYTGVEPATPTIHSRGPANPSVWGSPRDAVVRLQDNSPLAATSQADHRRRPRRPVRARSPRKHRDATGLSVVDGEPRCCTPRPVPGARCQVPGVCQVPGARCQRAECRGRSQQVSKHGAGTKCQWPGVRGQVPGARCPLTVRATGQHAECRGRSQQVSKHGAGTKCQWPGVRGQVPGARCPLTVRATGQHAECRGRSQQVSEHGAGTKCRTRK